MTERKPQSLWGEIKQEARAWAMAARLKRIWVPRAYRKDVSWSISDCYDEHGNYTEGFEFLAPIAPGVRFVYCNLFHLRLDLVREESTGQTGWIRYEDATRGSEAFLSTMQEKALYYSQGKENEYSQFAAQWMDFFRRGCWLSGCPIEATAHEKLEWMQEFTPQQIERWKLASVEDKNHQRNSRGRRVNWSFKIFLSGTFFLAFVVLVIFNARWGKNQKRTNDRH